MKIFPVKRSVYALEIDLYLEWAIAVEGDRDFYRGSRPAIPTKKGRRTQDLFHFRFGHSRLDPFRAADDRSLSAHRLNEPDHGGEEHEEGRADDEPPRKPLLRFGHAAIVPAGRAQGNGPVSCVATTARGGAMPPPERQRSAVSGRRGLAPSGLRCIREVAKTVSRRSPADRYVPGERRYRPRARDWRHRALQPRRRQT